MAFFDVSEHPESRRRFLRTASSLVAAGGVGAVGYAWGFEPHWTELVEREMPIVGLPSHWNGRKILHLSDLHVGGADEDYLSAQLRRVSEFVSRNSSRSLSFSSARSMADSIVRSASAPIEAVNWSSP